MQAAPLRALIALVLALLTLVSSGCRAWPGSGATPAPHKGEPLSLLQASRLQEVPPPGAVQALSDRLAERQPRVEIVAPLDDALLPDGPWTLQLRVSDWPLSDAADLGIGPHLVVQLDQQPPLQLSTPDAAAAVSMPPLQPGSHRLTVYAARPWGEAVKSPGALRQIRLHRVSRNLAELPARGSAQLIVASPIEPTQQEPVLLDWLLLDAPLQHLQNDDARWRLRVSVNGDSVLIDRQTPLWLNGFRPGSNAVQLELLDARGEPLNPPFNSLVREVVIGGSSGAPWRRSSLSDSQLALLSGEIPAIEPATPPAAEPVPDPEPRAEATAEVAIAPEAAPAQPAAPEAAPAPPDPAAPEDEPTGIATDADEADTSAPIAGETMGDQTPEASDELHSEPPETPARTETQPSTTPDSTEAVAPSPPLPPRPPAPSARELVNADGSLVKPRPRGPLAGLREKLGG